jgi:hypothetical protein
MAKAFQNASITPSAKGFESACAAGDCERDKLLMYEFSGYLVLRQRPLDRMRPDLGSSLQVGSAWTGKIG